MGKTFVYNSGNPLEDSPGMLKLCLGMFFDGTRNNRKNTEIRKKVEGKGEFQYVSATEEERRIFKKYAKDDNSFGNDFTNVARKSYCSDEHYTTYIEGISTIDEADDVGAGFKYGSGKTGVIGKVRRGCTDLATKIKIEKDNSIDDIETIELTIDIFGFSRGAAAARNFAYNLQMKEYAPKSYYPPVQGASRMEVDHETSEFDLVQQSWIKDGLLPKFGHLGTSLLQAGIARELVDSMIINVRFIGVYDTVASYDPSPTVGLPSFKKKIKELHLHELGSPKKAVHFTAVDEHRKNFSLTRFQPVILKTGIEKNFPGVHSDVGGSYNHDPLSAEEISEKEYSPDPIEGVTEKETVWLETNHFASELHDFRNELIAQGWFTKEQLHIGKKWNFRNFVGSMNVLSGTRYLYKGYSFIPLHFMSDYALPYLNEEKEYLLYSKLLTDYALNDPFLDEVKQYMKEHIIDKNELWNLKGNYSYEDENDNYIPENETETEITEQCNDEIEEGIILEEVIITSYTSDNLLRKLRNRYLHRSAKLNSLLDTLAYEPNVGRRRMEF